MDKAVPNLFAYRNWVQKFIFVVLVALYGLMSYQYLSAVINNKLGLDFDQGLLSTRFFYNFRWFGRWPDLNDSMYYGFGGGYWFLISALAFIIFFVALIFRKNLSGIFIIAHISQMVFFWKLQQQNTSSYSSIFDIAIPLLVGITSILLFNFFTETLVTKAMIFFAFLTLTFSILFIVHDYYIMYTQISSVPWYDINTESYRYKGFIDYIKREFSVFDLPFLIVRCGFAVFYFHIFISLIKTSFIERREYNRVLEYVRTQDSKQKPSVTATSNHNDQTIVNIKSDSSKTAPKKRVDSAESKSTLSPEKINKSDVQNRQTAPVNQISQTEQERTMLNHQDSNEQNGINLVQRGVHYKRVGNYQSSLSCYLQAEKVLSNEPDLYKSLGKIYYILGQFQKAVDSYKKYVRLTGDADINILMHMGHAICDPKATTSEEKAMAENYRCSIDPFFEQSSNRKFRNTRIGFDAEENYDQRCMNTAASMLR